MVVRKRKKFVKKLGSRTKHGNKKNARGAGTRGGVRRAGSHKHKYSKYWKDFGTKVTLKPKTKGKAINLWQLQEIIPKLIEEKKAQKIGQKVLIDGKTTNIEKILSQGEVKEAIMLKNIKASKKAIEKIIAKGGQIEEQKNKTETEVLAK